MFWHKSDYGLTCFRRSFVLGHRPRNGKCSSLQQIDGSAKVNRRSLVLARAPHDVFASHAALSKSLKAAQARQPGGTVTANAIWRGKCAVVEAQKNSGFTEDNAD
jgi:hypothetical protein